MRIVAHCIVVSVALLAACAFGGCGGESAVGGGSAGTRGDSTGSSGGSLASAGNGTTGATQDALLGTWTYSGSVPALVTVTLTFNADQKLKLVEQVSPPSEPAGSMASGCVTTDTLTGTYAEGVSGAELDTLRWAFSGGTANVQTGCEVSAYDTPGTPMTADAVSSYIEQGILPPMALTYTVTASSLVLTSKAGTGVGSSDGTTFTRVLAAGEDGAAGAAGASSNGDGDSELTCAIPTANGCPGDLILYTAQHVDSAKQCRLPEAAISCSAGASSAQTCWVDSETGDLYLLAQIPCKPAAKWRDCAQAEADSSAALPACR